MSVRIAVIFEGRLDRRHGVFNAVIERVTHLRALGGYNIDLHMVEVYDGAVMRRLRRSGNAVERVATAEVGGETLRMHWIRRSIADAVGHRIWNGEPRVQLHAMEHIADSLDGYDIYCAHDRIGAIVARYAGQSHGKPWYVTWHGTAIHTEPWRDKMLRRITVDLLRTASRNFFVSHALLADARRLAPDIDGDVLFNGVADEFMRYDDTRREELRRSLGVADCKLVTFAGRFEPVKNVAVLPDIFSRIAADYDGEVTFWAIGDGSRRNEVENALRTSGVKCVVWGNIAPDEMPKMLNCTDLLVMPSLNEGLPLIAAEAIACGAQVVATDAGGTAEVIGEKFTVPVNDNIALNIARRAVQLLSSPEPQSLPDEISWAATARKESDFIKSLL